MKKLIAISVVFALVAGVAFAVDLGGTVIGTVNVLESNTGDDAPVTSGGKMNRVRIEGSGEAGDGNFGGWLRFDATNGGVFLNDIASGIAWWKPIDQFKLSIGVNPDGHWGKEGTTGWMFYQTACDTGVTNPNNTWGGGGRYEFGLTTRCAFYGGYDGAGTLLEIKPMDMLGINIGLPFIANDGAETADIFKAMNAQIDLNLDFGNIAISYKGVPNYIQDGNRGWDGTDGGVIYAYFGGSFGDLSLDVGIGFQLANEDGTSNPISAGLGLKFASDAVGVKFRAAAAFGGEQYGGDSPMKVLVDVMPYFGLADNLTAFVSVGLGMLMPDGGDTVIGWHFNPYLQVGEEWGAKFLFGISVQSNGGDDAIISWKVPIAIICSF